MWEGREVEDGQHWQTDLNTVCTCTSGKVTCQANIKGKNDSAPDGSFSLSLSLAFSVFNFIAHIQEHTLKATCHFGPLTIT